MLPSHPDRSSPALPPPPARQLALPLAPVAGPPRLPSLGPPVRPGRVWRSLAPPAQAAVRQAVTRVYQEVFQDLRPVEPEEVAHEHPTACR